MRIRQSFNRQESGDSRRPLINNSPEDTDASTLSLISQRTNDNSQAQCSSSNAPISKQISRPNVCRSSDKIERPMAFMHMKDCDSVDGRPKRPPVMPQQQTEHAERKLSAPTISEKKAIESQVIVDVDRTKDNIESVQSSKQSSRRTVSLRDANKVPEERLRLKHTSSSGSNSQSNSSVRPVRKSASQRQVKSGYGSKFTRAFTRKSGFNLIFDEVGGFGDGFNSDSSTDVESDLQKFEHLYRKVHKKLRKRSRQEDSQEEQMPTSSDPEMSPASEDEKKMSCKEVFAGRRMRKWAFWFIIAFLGALTIKDVIELITEYRENPKQSVINIVFNDTMQMPNLTFCMGKNQAYSHFNLTIDKNWDNIIDQQLAKLPDRDSFLKSTWNYRMTVEGYEVISSLSSLERETESIHGMVHAITKFRELTRLEDKRKMIKKWVAALEARDVTFDEFTQKVGIEIIRPSMQRFQRFTFNEDLTIQTKFHTSWISEQQFCFQPYSHDPNYMLIEDQGSFFTMSLSHNSDNLNNKSINCLSVDFHGRSASLNRFMEGKGRTRDGFDDNLCAGQYHEVAVEVKALYEMLENNDNGTICREQKENEDNEFDCKSRCRMEMIREWCQCTPLTLSYLIKDPKRELQKYPLCDYSTCILDVQTGNYTDLDCQSHCHRDCRQIRYTVNHKTQGRLLRPDMTVIELHWGSFEYLRTKQEWVWSVTTFIAALGGSIGMWLGLSILSLIQGGSFIYSYLTDNVIKKKIGKRRASIVPSVLPEASTGLKPELNADLKANPFENPFKAKISRQHLTTPPPNNNKDVSRIQIE